MRLLYLMAILFAVVGSLGAAATEKQKCSRIVASGPPEYAPLSYIHNGEIEGIGPSLARMVGEDIGVPVVVNNVGSWRRAVRLLEVGEIDLLVSLYKTPERESFMAFTSPFWREDTVLIMRRSDPVHYESWSDLVPLKGATIGGDSRGEAFDRFLKEKLDVVYTPLQENLVAMLRAKRVDYLVLGRNSMFVEDFESADSDLVTHPTPVDSHDVYMAFSKASECHGLADKFSRVLDRFRTEGKIKELFQEQQSNMQKP